MVEKGRRFANKLHFKRQEGWGWRKVAQFIVAIAYGKGIVCGEQYEGQMTGKLFASFITEKFDRVFANSANPRGKLFLQDGDPSQNSKVASDTMAKIGARLFSIPPRSPDHKPIENMFHLINRQLQTYALEHNIVHEARVKE